MEFPAHFTSESRSFTVQPARSDAGEAQEISDLLYHVFSDTYIGMKGNRHVKGFPLPLRMTVTEAHIGDTVYSAGAPERLRQRLISTSNPASDLMYLVAKVQGRERIAAMGKFNLAESEIDELDVYADLRGHGIGKAVMYVGLAAIQQRHSDEVQVGLQVVEGNTRAQKWYDSLGFTVTKQERVEIFQGGPLLRWIGMTAAASEVRHNLATKNPWLAENSAI